LNAAGFAGGLCWGEGIPSQGIPATKADMDTRTHWEKIYRTRAPDAVSWYRPHLETSLALIERAAGGGPSASIIDVGGGESTLVDDLLARGYKNVSVLDFSQTAIDVTKKRLGLAAERVHWLVADILTAQLEPFAFEVWHDRAVFHFLTSMEQRAAYVRKVAKAVRPGGHVIVSTFGPEGPEKCSGLEVMRYDAEALHDQFGARFHLVESSRELHETPFGTTQQFLYCYCRVERED
jgi:SAM-dependent methyltransferase